MKSLAILLFASILACASCTKDKLPAADDSSATVSAASGSGKVEDNPNGGGGNNIAAASVPAAVKSAFTSRYPGATNIQWKLKNGQYKVEFFIGAVKWQAIFAPNGSLLKQERA